MSDLISRADAMGAVQDHFNDDGFKGYDDGQKMMDRIKSLPSAETHDKRTETHGVCSDLISRADAIEAVEYNSYGMGSRASVKAIKALPSADRELANLKEGFESADAEQKSDAYKRGFDDCKRAYEIELARSADAVHKPGYSYEADMVRRLKEALSAEAGHGWVPCSERMPNESGDYLCTIPLDEVDTYVDVLSFHKSRFYEDDAEWGATYHDDVIAWMDLPKPYKGGD